MDGWEIDVVLAEAIVVDEVVRQIVDGRAIDADLVEEIADVYGPGLPSAFFQGHFYAPPTLVEDTEDATAVADQEQKRPLHWRDVGVQAELDIPCPSYAMVGEAECGCRFASTLICNREWCESCRDAAQGRRVAKWVPRAQQLRTMGYLVVTLPEEVRGRYRTASSLGKLGTSVKRLLQRLGIERGLRRWHFFGDEEPHDYHPHLNILIDWGWMSPELLEEIKDGVGRILKVARERVNVFYEYAEDVGEKMHILSYTLRPTFLNWRWDEELAWNLKGLRNSSWWGKWEDPPAWEISAGADVAGAEISALQAGKCPEHGKPITWYGPPMNAMLLLSTPYWRDLGGGYLRFVGPGPPDKL